MTIKESNFIAKNRSTFSLLLTVRAKGADPPSLTVSLTVKTFFYSKGGSALTVSKCKHVDPFLHQNMIL